MTVSAATVQKALELVFGLESDFSAVSSLHIVNESQLRSAYRKKAMHFHPDRAEALGLDEQTLDELLKRLHGAYRLLGRVIDNDESLLVSPQPHHSDTNPSPARGPADRSSTSRASRRASRPSSESTTHRAKRRSTYRPEDQERGYGDHNRARSSAGRRFYRGRTPEKKLRFAQFLYYNGLIDWQAMIDAVTWQLNNRPKIGEIGRAYKFFDHSGVISIIRQKERVELFGSAAMRMGLVNRFQLNAMVGKQQSLNYPIGRYFLEHGTFSRYDLETLLTKSKAHNRKYA